MLELYINRDDIKEKILDFNDDFFDINKGKLSVDKIIANLAYKIDGAKFVSNTEIKTRFGKILDTSYLSTGCKTAINVYLHPEMIINTVECGNNAMQEILKLENGKILNELGFSWSNDNCKVNILLHDHGTDRIFNTVDSLVDCIQGV